jgi:putative membrane protein
MTERDRRRPHWVYGDGEEPDYRFSFANERTFLAWIRTALAFLAGGVAVENIDLAMTDPVKSALAAVLVVIGMLCATSAWFRWALAERAMRRAEPLPGSRHLALLVGGITAIGLVLVVVAAVG